MKNTASILCAHESHGFIVTYVANVIAAFSSVRDDVSTTEH